MSIVKQYVSKCEELGAVVVPWSDIQEAFKAAGKVTIEEVIGYSAIPTDSKGHVVSSLDKAELVFMPHVIARGDGTKEASVQMHKAGFRNEGLCKGRTEYSVRVTEAQRLVNLLIKAGGFPGVNEAAVAVQEAPKAKRTRKAPTPVEAVAEE